MARDGAPAHFNIDEVLAHVVDAVARRAQDKGLEFVVHRSRDVPAMLVGDGERLLQVLTHLARNAVQYTASGEVSIAVDRERGGAGKDDGTIALHFSVTDTGIGVNDKIATLFRPLRRAAAPQDTPASGLLVVNELVQSLGGAIEVVSASGIGSDFSFAARFGAVPDGGAGATPNFTGLRALVVDDNDSARQAIQHLLEAAGCAVVAASDGNEALGIVASPDGGCFDVAIVDYGMPGMDGLETVRCLCRSAAAPAPAALLLVTPPHHEEIAARARRLAIPVRDFLAKPVDAATLYRTASDTFRETPRRPAPLPPAALVDETGALQRLGGNRDLLGRLLAEFHGTENDAAQAVQRLIAAGRLEEAARRVHTAKGTAMILGLERVAAVAAPLDKALRRGDVDCATALLPSFARELAAGVAACGRWCEARPAAAAVESSPDMPSPEVLQPLLDRLCAQAGRNSMSALQPAQELARLLRGTRHGDVAAEVDGLLHKLDFAAARERLQQLADDLSRPDG